MWGWKENERTHNFSQGPRNMAKILLAYVPVMRNMKMWGEKGYCLTNRIAKNNGKQAASMGAHVWTFPPVPS
jgi:hypothetical protein